MNIEDVKAWANDPLTCTHGIAKETVDWLISEHDRLTSANKVLTEAVEWGVEQFRDYGKNNRADILKQKANL